MSLPSAERDHLSAAMARASARGDAHAVIHWRAELEGREAYYAAFTRLTAEHVTPEEDHE